MPVEHLLRGRSRVGYGPVINRGLRHDSDGIFRYPFPEGDVLSISVGFDLGLGLDIEYLQCPTGCARSTVSLSPAVKKMKRSGAKPTSEGQNLLVGMHNRGVRIDWPT